VGVDEGEVGEGEVGEGEGRESEVTNANPFSLSTSSSPILSSLLNLMPPLVSPCNLFYTHPLIFHPSHLHLSSFYFKDAFQRRILVDEMIMTTPV
jgi:hypothetical protein